MLPTKLLKPGLSTILMGNIIIFSKTPSNRISVKRPVLFALGVNQFTPVKYYIIHWLTMAGCAGVWVGS